MRLEGWEIFVDFELSGHLGLGSSEMGSSDPLLGASGSIPPVEKSLSDDLQRCSGIKTETKG